MFAENENPVIDEITENVEETTEELTDGAKVEDEAPAIETFTKEQVDEMIAKKLARKEAKIRKEYDRKYGNLENVLRAGTGEDDIDKITDAFTNFYETKKGITIPKTPQLSDRQVEVLANDEANVIIEAGYDEIKDELNRLSDIGFDNMSKTDKHIFLKLKQEADRITNEKELKSIGISELPDDFKDFSSKLNPELSMKEKYEMYVKLNPKKEVKTIGSMKSGQMNKVKDYYTEDFKGRTTDNSKNMVKIGGIIAKKLNDNGIKTLHDKTQHDYPEYTGSYNRAAKTINSYLKKYPMLFYFIVTPFPNGTDEGSHFLRVFKISQKYTTLHYEENSLFPIAFQKAIWLQYPLPFCHRSSTGLLVIPIYFLPFTLLVCTYTHHCLSSSNFVSF